MLWPVAAAAFFFVIGAIARRSLIRERARCAAHARQLRALMQRARNGDPAPLRAHVKASHERGPGRESAEAWLVLGYTLLDSGKPEEATRAFQVACHACPGLNTAILLAFTCLKTRAADMPTFLPRLLETYADLHHPLIPGSRWEKVLLGGLHMPDMSRPGLSDLARSLLMLPVRCVQEQVAEAVKNNAPWAAGRAKAKEPRPRTMQTHARSSGQS